MCSLEKTPFLHYKFTKKDKYDFIREFYFVVIQVFFVINYLKKKGFLKEINFEVSYKNIFEYEYNHDNYMEYLVKVGKEFYVFDYYSSKAVHIEMAYRNMGDRYVYLYGLMRSRTWYFAEKPSIQGVVEYGELLLILNYPRLFSVIINKPIEIEQCYFIENRITKNLAETTLVRCWDQSYCISLYDLDVKIDMYAGTYVRGTYFKPKLLRNYFNIVYEFIMEIIMERLRKVYPFVRSMNLVFFIKSLLAYFK